MGDNRLEPLVLSEAERLTLQGWTRRRTTAQGPAKRAGSFSRAPQGSQPGQQQEFEVQELGTAEAEQVLRRFTRGGPQAPHLPGARRTRPRGAHGLGVARSVLYPHTITGDGLIRAHGPVIADTGVCSRRHQASAAGHGPYPSAGVMWPAAGRTSQSRSSAALHARGSAGA